MSNRKTTKRALLTSVMALVMCVVMLVGTTFAWFTDTASTGVNKIQAGNLDVDIIDMQGNSLDGKTLTWQKASGAESEDVLWEPGCTYYLTPFMIQNKGNLALKYKVTINGVSGDNKLLEALEFGFYYFSVGFGVERSLDELIEGGKLDNVAEYPGLCTAPIYIVAHMKEDAGNEYKGLTIDGISITVAATQYTYESDSFDETYDEDATYPVTDNAGLSDAISGATAGDTVVIASGEYDLPKSGNIASGVTIAGAGKDKTTLNAENAKVSKDDVTLKDMTIKGSGSAGTGGTLNINGNNTTIENVDYEGDGNIAITVSTGKNNTGTTFRGTKITNAFRGIQFWSLSGDSVIDNCVLDVAGYTFNIDSAVAGSTLTITDSTLNGWTSYTSGIKQVTFDNCKLGLNAYQYLRPYSETKLINCEFTSAGYQLNAGGSGAYTITLTNCTKNGTAITADNVKTLLLDTDDWNTNATLIVNGTTVAVS